jgi:hypothetical protein
MIKTPLLSAGSARKYKWRDLKMREEGKTMRMQKYLVG